MAADSDRALEASPELIGHFKDLVKEAGALFGAHHYRSYHFLYTLSDHVAHFGLEHHESSDDRTGERTLIDPDALRASGYLLPHEFVHSWNGKYRRPAGLISGGRDGGYDTPMKGDLLWVYEGLTNYLGEILTPRSGLWSAEDYRESLAETAAELDNKYGRTWRPLEDTAVAAQVLYEAGGDYQSLRRSVDYYAEGTLIWLEADVLIRQLSKGAKSLDDFCKLFHGGTSGPPALKPYNFDDVVAALNTVQPYDWAGFLNQRLHSTEARAPLGGIEHSGWKLTYDGVRSDFWKAREETRKIIDLTYSIGMLIGNDDGIVADVRYGGPAQKAGTRAVGEADRGEHPAVHAHRAARSHRQDRHRRQAPRTPGEERRVLPDLPHRLSRRREVSAPDPGYRDARSADGHPRAESEEVETGHSYHGTHDGWSRTASERRPRCHRYRRAVSVCPRSGRKLDDPDLPLHARAAFMQPTSAVSRGVDSATARTARGRSDAVGDLLVAVDRDGCSLSARSSRRGWRRPFFSPPGTGCPGSGGKSFLPRRSSRKASSREVRVGERALSLPGVEHWRSRRSCGARHDGHRSCRRGNSSTTQNSATSANDRSVHPGQTHEKLAF